jgi:formate hydrogenlyase subunit 3/multisubunit Na+/H+ antiporter MnhD subunit
VGILVLAGTPGLAGFPGLWLVVRRLPEGWDAPLAPLALLAASFLLFATAVRRWQIEGPADADAVSGAPGARRAVIALIVTLVVLGVAPQVIAPAFTGALREIFLPLG